MNVFTNIRLDKNMRKRYHLFCVQNDTTISERLRQHIADDLKIAAIQTPSQKKRELNEWLKNEWGTEEEQQQRKWEDSY